jgi:dTDP-N-acetylfucosamine:lipid II N-acetylfucosaminyltransferase
MKYKFIHIFPNEKFIEPFISFMGENFDTTQHLFIYLEGKDKKDFPIKNRKNSFIVNNINKFIKNVFYIRKFFIDADKIFIHGLYKWYFVLFLSFHKKLLFKLYWIMWGSDLYQYYNRNNNILNRVFEIPRSIVIKNIGNFVTYIKGDYELAEKWYSAKGKYHECFMYPSNLYKEYDLRKSIIIENQAVNIQLGNSADPTNHHIEILNKLLQYKNEDIKIFVPLSYGDKEYAQSVIAKGKEFFGEKFVALTDFMSFDKYLEFLGDIDIAIFAHKRQQAMGNKITLLGLGKKVYMRSDITPWQLFNDIDVKVFDVDDIEVNFIDEETKKENQQKIKEYFSEENYLKQLQNLFESK